MKDILNHESRLAKKREEKHISEDQFCFVMTVLLCLISIANFGAGNYFIGMFVFIAAAIYFSANVILNKKK